MKRTRNFQLLKYLVGKRNVIDVLTKFLKTQDLGIWNCIYTRNTYHKSLFLVEMFLI